jgi:hypothetical protein
MHVTLSLQSLWLRRVEIYVRSHTVTLAHLRPTQCFLDDSLFRVELMHLRHQLLFQYSFLESNDRGKLIFLALPSKE